MPEYKFDVPRIRDRDIFKFFCTVSEIIGSTSFSITEFGSRGQTNFDLSDPTITSSSFFAKSNLFTIYKASVTNNTVSVAILRQADQPDTVTDRLSFNNSPDQGQIAPEKIHQINKVINETFISGPEPFVGLFHNQKTFTALIKSHQQMLGQLQSTATNVTESIAAAHARLEQDFAARAAQLDDDFQRRTAKADEDLEAERRILRDKEDALAARSRDLDDRDNTTARRAQHATLKSRIAERGSRFVITPETKRARLPIHLATFVACATILSFLIYYTAALGALDGSTSLPVVIATTAKPIGLTIALLGLVAWYLRWMNRWFERHADAEFYLKQFELDIDRANWVVETALEWKEKQERSIPDALLESISRSLFAKNERDNDADMHPADYLASAILGRASSVNLKVPGGEIALNGRDLRKLAKDDLPA